MQTILKQFATYEHKVQTISNSLQTHPRKLANNSRTPGAYECATNPAIGACLFELVALHREAPKVRTDDCGTHPAIGARLLELLALDREAPEVRLDECETHPAIVEASAFRNWLRAATFVTPNQFCWAWRSERRLPRGWPEATRAGAADRDHAAAQCARRRTYATIYTNPLEWNVRAIRAVDAAPNATPNNTDLVFRRWLHEDCCETQKPRLDAYAVPRSSGCSAGFGNVARIPRSCPRRAALHPRRCCVSVHRVAACSC